MRENIAHPETKAFKFLAIFFAQQKKNTEQPRETHRCCVVWIVCVLVSGEKSCSRNEEIAIKIHLLLCVCSNVLKTNEEQHIAVFAATASIYI